MEPISFGLFGLIVGSFLNVLILRYPERGPGGRSACMHCKRQLFWYDNVPLISWVLLGGRCRFCRDRISIQYPLVEATTAGLFALIGAVPAAMVLKVVALPIVALLIAITVYDYYHTIIPDVWSYSFAALALLSQLVSGFAENFSVWTLLAGPIVAFPLFLLWLFSRGTWMGLGDPKLALGIGWLLGISSGVAALFLAFILGGVASIPLLFFSSRPWKRFVANFILKGRSHLGIAEYTMKSEIPFGPFLIAGCLVVWFADMYGMAVLFPWQIY